MSNKRKLHTMPWKNCKSLKTVSIFSSLDDHEDNIINNDADQQPQRDNLQVKQSKNILKDVHCSINDSEEHKLSHHNEEVQTLKQTFNDLKCKGCVLAEEGKLKEALSCWQKALTLKDDDFKIYEMQAQVLMMLDNDFSAAKSAERAVQLNKLWWVSWQTLGRVQLNLHDPKLATKSLSHALHLNPMSSDLITDLSFASSAVKKIELLQAERFKLWEELASDMYPYG